MPRKKQVLSGQHVFVRFVSMMGLALGISSRKFAFVALSGLAATMLFVSVGRYNHIVMWQQVSGGEQQHSGPKPPSLDLESCPAGNSSSAKKIMCLRHEVYVIRTGNSMADVDVLKQLLTSSECALTSVYHVHVVSYEDSGHVARTDNETRGLLQQSMRECALQGTSVQLDFQNLSGKRSVFELNRMMMDSYVFDGIDFVSLIFSGGFGSGSGSGLPVLASAAGFVGALVRSSPKYVGAGFQGGAGTTPSTPGSTPGSTWTPGARVFFSRTHFEIFGFFLPPELTKLEKIPEFFQLVYAGHQLTTMITTTTNGDVVVQPISIQSQSNNSLGLNLDEYKATLDKYIEATVLNPCLRCVNGASRMVIAMSLYGSSPRYTMGAVRNAQLRPVVFPGWRLWLYAERPDPATGRTKYGSVPPAVIARLRDLGAEIVWVDVARVGLAPMLWRFTVAEDPTVDAFAVRDCDSRLTSRDAAVVADWLRRPDRLFHCVRDHPSHSNYAVSGGLWGARRAGLQRLLGNLSGVMRGYGAGYVQDMHFLGRDVWPKVKDDAYCHDSFSCDRYPSSHPFPVARIGYEHLGQVYDQFSTGRQNDINILKRAPVNRKCVPV